MVVSVYYRLNVFGFLAHPALEDPSVGALNAGFLDQIEALRWVQSNIRSFGGDPEKVTINGQSAGGSSVELHLVANNQGNDQLFSGAIAQSVFRIGLPTVEQQKVGYWSLSLPSASILKLGKLDFIGISLAKHELHTSYYP